MFLRKIRTKKKVYYYLAHRAAHQEKVALLACLGSLCQPTIEDEYNLVREWAWALCSGTERSKQKSLNGQHKAAPFRLSQKIDFEQCMSELTAIYFKYGFLTKSLLEKQARPKGELSWGVQTVMKYLKKRNLSLKEVFDQIKSTTPQSF